MKKLSLLIIAFAFPIISIAQDEGDLENKFYFRLGLSVPTTSYFGIENNSDWDDTNRRGGVLELGSIFILNSLQLSDGLRLGINVDYAEFSYHHLSSTMDDSAIGIFTLSSKAGPSISYNIVSDLIIDGYVKFKMPWVAGVAFTDSNGSIEDESFSGTIGTGYSMGINIRYRFVMLCFDFNNAIMKLEHSDLSDVYLGNGKDDSDKTPMPCFNYTLGFCF